MPFIVWNDQLSVEDDELDADHKQLVAILNLLYDALGNECSRDLLGEILEELTIYTKLHFAYEERMIDESHFPDAEAHKALHRQAGEWLAETRTRFQDGTLPGPTLEVMNYLKDWLFQHIIGEDKRYTPYIRRMAIDEPAHSCG